MRLQMTLKEDDNQKYDDQIILNIMDKLDERTVREFMKEYNMDEYSARKSLAEMTYVHNFIR